MGFEHCYSHDRDLTSIFVATRVCGVGRRLGRCGWTRRVLWRPCVAVRGIYLYVRVLGGDVTRNRNRDRSVQGPHKVTVHTVERPRPCTPASTEAFG
jgi:hypothetical protein